MYYLFGDHLGSTALVTNSNGLQRVRYKPWGGVRYTSGNAPADNDYTYTGQRQDSYINLLWYGSRWYDPLLGQFISPDSIVPDPYNPIDFDRFQYVRSNPLTVLTQAGISTVKTTSVAMNRLPTIQLLWY